MVKSEKAALIEIQIRDQGCFYLWQRIQNLQERQKTVDFFQAIRVTWPLRAPGAARAQYVRPFPTPAASP
jgi:hypothetical protein